MATRDLIDNINTRRINWCCDQVGMEPDTLARALNFSAEKVRKGELTYNQLQKLSDYFGHTPLFFLEAGLPDDRVHSTEFRTLANQEVLVDNIDNTLYKLIRQAEQHRDTYIHLLEETGDIAEFSPPSLTGSVNEMAQQVRDWLGIEDDGTCDFHKYREKIEEKKVLVMLSQGYNGKWKLKKDTPIAGFSMLSHQVPLIFIRKTSPQMQSFTLFHELGHLLLHQHSHIDNNTYLRSNQSNKIEREANQFAASCLLPDYLLERYIGNIPAHVNEYDNEFKALAEQTGISVEVIVVALLKKGKLSQINYEDYKNYRTTRWKEQVEQQDSAEPMQASRKYRNREPIHIFGKRYVSTVLDALHAEKITLSKASNYLDRLKVADIGKLSEHLVRMASATSPN